MASFQNENKQQLSSAAAAAKKKPWLNWSSGIKLNSLILSIDRRTQTEERDASKWNISSFHQFQANMCTVHCYWSIQLNGLFIAA